MLRGRKRIEVFAAVFSEAGWNRARGDERDAGVFAARRCGDRDAKQEAVGGAVPARCGRRLEHRISLLWAKLLPAAADDCDSAASERRGGCGDRLGWILRIAS